jgi:hypothetical protein
MHTKPILRRNNSAKTEISTTMRIWVEQIVWKQCEPVPLLGYGATVEGKPKLQP